MSFITIDRENDKVIRFINGKWNEQVYEELNKLIFNLAKRFYKTNNVYFTLDDLKNEAWFKTCKLFNTYATKNEDLKLKYLNKAINSHLLQICINTNKRMKVIDDTSTMFFNSDDIGSNGSIITNVQKQAVELEAIDVFDRLSQDDEILLRVALEQTLESLKEEDHYPKYLIILEYIIEYGGESKIITEMYNKFINTLDEAKKEVLNKMIKLANDNADSKKPKFTFRDAWLVLGIRGTDNCTSRYRKRVKEIKSEVYGNFLNA